MKESYYIGLMSGTSMDAVDAVLVDLGQHTPVVLSKTCIPLKPELRKSLSALYQPGKNEINQLGRMDITLGRLFADAALQLLSETRIKPDDIIAIGSHGQTLRHEPDGETPFSLQIGDPNTIAELTGITTIADFRRRDMAAGGQGAPLVPAFHEAIFRLNDRNRVILNIGGIANITVLPAIQNRRARGFDTGPGNTLLDSWIYKQQRKNKDERGRWAASGEVDDELLERMLKDPYFQKPPPKSTGREYFNLAWLDKILKRHKKRMLKKNVQATLCELTARSIVDAINTHAPDTNEILVCGGGVHNLALMMRIQMFMDNTKVISTEEYNIDPDYVEAIAFAWLAKQTLAGKTGNLPAVTGAHNAVILGGIYQA